MSKKFSLDSSALERNFGITVSMRSSCACPVIATRASRMVMMIFLFIFISWRSLGTELLITSFGSPDTS